MRCIKIPLLRIHKELVAGFIRAIGIPVDIADVESHLASDLGMGITQAPSVFWWDPSTWTSPSVSLAKTNFYSEVLDDLSAQRRNEDNPNDDWVPTHSCPNGNVDANGLINFVSGRMGVEVPSALRDQLVFYVDHRINSSEEFVVEPYDSTDDSIVRRKCMGLYYILGMTPRFLSK